MKDEPKIGDYVGFKKPYVGDYPIGIVVDSFPATRWVSGITAIDYTKPIYEIRTPTNSPNCTSIPVWRQAAGLKKSTHKQYVNQTVLKMLEI